MDILTVLRLLFHKNSNLSIYLEIFLYQDFVYILLDLVHILLELYLKISQLLGRGVLLKWYIKFNLKCLWIASKNTSGFYILTLYLVTSLSPTVSSKNLVVNSL